MSDVAAVGVDCSSKRLAFVKLQGRDVWQCVVNAKGSWTERLAILADGARAEFEQLRNTETQPCLVYIEEAPLGRSYRSSTEVSYVIGVTIVEAIRAGHVVVPVNVSTWKKQTIGAGNADKALIKEWATEFIFKPAGVDPLPAEQDLYDAACIAAFARQNLRGTA